MVILNEFNVSCKYELIGDKTSVEGSKCNNCSEMADDQFVLMYIISVLNATLEE